jgi:cGMP-dependent 3',5'-cyclic phosphodiesterase
MIGLQIAPEDILRLTVRDIPASTSYHADFTQFSFVPRSIGTGDIYIEACLSMFKVSVARWPLRRYGGGSLQELGFIERYRFRRRTLARFLLMVQKGYRDVPYHNFSHAFAVGHFCFLLLRMPAVKAALTDLERLSLLVACLCHDIDHRGTTNAFQLQSVSPRPPRIAHVRFCRRRRLPSCTVPKVRYWNGTILLKRSAFSRWRTATSSKG